ncbi:MAG: hypothetical protein FWD90_01915 [Defluviitaleaceae bacterium]|nr:hypothetical protein [Defluviitaleaceae bacterium]
MQKILSILMAVMLAFNASVTWCDAVVNTEKALTETNSIWQEEPIL